MTPTNPTPKRRRDWRPAFLASFAATGNVLLSARGAGIDRSVPYDERRRNPSFAAAWQRAEEDAIQLLEAEARRRAMHASDVLLMFLLKSRRPAIYRDHARLELTRRHSSHELVALLGGDEHGRRTEAYPSRSFPDSPN